MDGALTPSPTRDRALSSCLAALLFLGAHHAMVEWAPAFALWSVGRATPWRWLPSVALVALHAFAVAMVVTRARRLAAAAACAVLAVLYAAVPATYHNNHYLLFLLLLLVAAVPVDLSRAVRWQLSLVYLCSAVVKLAHPWWQGSGAVLRWLAETRAPEANPGALLPRLLAPVMSRSIPSRLADVATIALELALPFALASPRSRRHALVVGLLLHLSMQEWLFPQLFTFLMLVGYAAWSPADDRAWVFSLDTAAHPGWARLVSFADVLGRVRIVESAGVTTLTNPDGVALRGWRALPWLAALSPLTVVAYAALALAFPDVHAIGAVPRDAVENLAVLVFLLGLVAARLTSPGPRTLWEKNLPPR